MAQVRQDAARDQAGLRAALEARIAAAVEARDGFQARAEHAEAELQRARADRDSGGQAGQAQANPETRRAAAGALGDGGAAGNRLPIGLGAAPNTHVVVAEVRGIFGVPLHELPGAAAVPWPGPWRTPSV